MSIGAPKAPPRGNETILLVEPEPETRKLASFMLAKQGYRVLEARSAAEAVEMYDLNRASVDLLFTEAVMSKVNGHQLAQALSVRDPELKVLYLSDKDYEEITRRIATQKRLAFLARPFTMGTLAVKVREVLDVPRGRTAATG